MTIETIITKLQAVRSSTKSESNKQLLTECVDDLRNLQRVSLQEQEGKVIYHVTQRVKLKETFGLPLTPEGKAKRFLINTIDEKKNQVWVVDPQGKERPCWIPMSFIEPADD